MKRTTPSWRGFMTSCTQVEEMWDGLLRVRQCLSFFATFEWKIWICGWQTIWRGFLNCVESLLTLLSGFVDVGEWWWTTLICVLCYFYLWYSFVCFFFCSAKIILYYWVPVVLEVHITFRYAPLTFCMPMEPIWHKLTYYINLRYFYLWYSFVCILSFDPYCVFWGIFPNSGIETNYLH